MAAYSISSRCVDIINFAILMVIAAGIAQFLFDELSLSSTSASGADIKEFKINEVPVLYCC